VTFPALSDPDCVGGSQIRSGEIKMTWSEYRKECQMNNVEPTKADFNGIELTDAQVDARILRTVRKITKQQPQQALAATT